MSNEGASITAMSDISDRAAFDNSHRQQRHTDTWRKKNRDVERAGVVKEGWQRRGQAGLIKMNG